MKKVFYSLLLAIVPVLALSLSSCNNDDDLPNVNISLGVENGTVVDGIIYVVQGDTLNVTSLTVENNEAGKGAALTNVRYFIDGFYVGESFYMPFPLSCVTTENTSVGNYDLGVACTVLAADKSIASAALNYPFKVVANAEDIPGEKTDTGTTTKSVTLK